MTKLITATRRFQFCCGHRVHKHESKCGNAHGHNYVLFITARAPELDSLGRVIDFSELKARMGKWIDENWDHGFVYYAKDNQMAWLFSDQFLEHKSFAMPSNPTAENMARFLLEEICPRIFEGTGITIIKTVLWETENCYAEASL